MKRVRRAAARPGRVVLVLTALVVVLLAGGWAYVQSGPERVPPNTFVAGVPVGGLDAARLTAVLGGPVRARVEVPLEVTAGTDRFELSSRDLGIRLDVAGTARAALRGRGLRDRVPLLSRPRREIAPQLAMDAAVAEATLTLKLDGVRHGVVNARIDLPAPKVVLEAQGDARFTPRSVRAVVHPGRTGQSVDMSTAAVAIRTAVATGQHAVTLAVHRVKPQVSTAALGRVDQLIGTFTTHHACCEPRVTNIHRMAQIVDGTVVLPGATFSLNRASGRRTAANGFVAAPAIADGELVQQFGGGVSQFSTTLFNATWFSGLPTLKHQPHSKYISRYPPGREATLDYDTIDQVFRNDTAAPVVIRTATTGTSVTVALYGHTGNREVTSFTGPRTPRTGGGFSIGVRREIRQGESLISSDTVQWTYTGLD